MWTRLFPKQHSTVSVGDNKTYYKNTIHLKSGGLIESVISVNISRLLSQVVKRKQKHVCIQVKGSDVWLLLDNIAVVESVPTDAPSQTNREDEKI